jgi:hypothetical protein
MDFEEGQIYEGRVSLMGEEGPLRNWLVVAPFGKLHIHSIDDPLDLHCWPAATLKMGSESERVRLVGNDAGHPVIRLQRLKEEMGIQDSDLGLSNENLHKMLRLLHRLLDEQSELGPYAAGEVLALMRRSPIPLPHAKSIERHILNKLKSSYTSFAPDAGDAPV